jgi:hypothetical protein
MTDTHIILKKKKKKKKKKSESQNNPLALGRGYCRTKNMTQRATTNKQYLKPDQVSNKSFLSLSFSVFLICPIQYETQKKVLYLLKSFMFDFKPKQFP